MSEENEHDIELIDADSILKLNAEDGDTLVVTLPERADTLPDHIRQQYVESIQASFDNIYQDKLVRVIVIPFGMKVELALTSQLEDKDNDASIETE